MVSKAALKRWVRRTPLLQGLRFARIGHQARNGGQPDWTAILGADLDKVRAAREQADRDGGPRVLIATTVGGHMAMNALDSLVAVALTLSGARVDVLLCDGILPACMACDITLYPNQDRFLRKGPSRTFCPHCFDPARAVYEPLGIPVRRLGADVTEQDKAWAKETAAPLTLAELKAFKGEDGRPLGDNAHAGALRYYARGSLEGEPKGLDVAKSFLEAALLADRAGDRLIGREGYETVVLHHGIYVPQGTLAESARRQGARVSTWNLAYRKGRVIFSHDDTYHHTMMTEPTAAWEDLPWDEAREARLMDYLKSRWTGAKDWIWFHERPRFDLTDIARETGVDFSKPVIGLLTSVNWDAQLHYPANAFPDMMAWIAETVEAFAHRPDLQLLIRVHPAEIHGALPSRHKVVDELAQRFPKGLPANVFLIPPESSVSTYAAMAQADSVIIYNTKTGVELTAMGIPVIVAGEAWTRGKGFTHDAKSAEDYRTLLDSLPLGHPMDDATRQRARKYAYHFFFRRMIPLDTLAPRDGWPPFAIAPSNGVDSLRPGVDMGLDVIRNGILTGTPFIYRDEQVDGDGAPEAARSDLGSAPPP
ncbi:MAG: capsule biosynthesis protein [Rhodospirillum sp.]|nr:capsule biosynthesis protein [Rhodospirillum sp.]MCF8488089.1 capsule biosynthesis protein [Rhodospirillum sp.]MCF8499885.1 capsule biosynthesis protein [Rhodospirillum sp.]